MIFRIFDIRDFVSERNKKAERKGGPNETEKQDYDCRVIVEKKSQ